MGDSSLIVLSPGAAFQRRYRVVRCIKAGGMGVVYEVLDERVDAPRALKVMLPGVVEAADMRARFAEEARITGGIESEHVVRTMDAGVDDETAMPFLVMELLRGEDLGAHLAKRGALSPREVVTYLFQVSLALDKTHAAGIVHRDLKPENLFLTRRDDGSVCIKVLDFGIAKVIAQSGRGSTTRSLGTPLYMAPEQATGKGALGPRADVYALGNIAHALLAGEPYWDAEWRAAEAPLGFLAEVARGVREPASARAARLGVELPAAFDGWFLKATAVHPDERFASAGEAVEALAEAFEVPLPRPSFEDDSASPPPSDPSGMATEPAMPSSVGERTEPMAPAAERSATRTSGTTSTALSREEPRPPPAPRRLRAIAIAAAGLGVLAAGLLAARFTGERAPGAPIVEHAGGAAETGLRAAARDTYPPSTHASPQSAPPSSASAAPASPPAPPPSSASAAPASPPAPSARDRDRKPAAPRKPAPAPSAPPPPEGFY